MFLLGRALVYLDRDFFRFLRILKCFNLEHDALLISTSLKAVDFLVSAEFKIVFFNLEEAAAISRRCPTAFDAVTTSYCNSALS